MPHHKHRAHPHPRAVDEVAGDSADIVGEPMAQLDERQMATIVSVVYVTAAPTFSGPVGGYTTLGPAVGDPVSAPAATASAASSVAQDTLSPESSVTPTASVVASALSSAAASSTSASSVSGSSSPSSTISPSSSVLSSTALASSSVAPTSTDESAQSTALGASATSSNASPTATSSSSSQGMSGGAKAGLAIGLIFGIGLILGLILFCFRRKKQQQEASYAKADDEKSAYGNRPGYAPSARSTNAPRLSLRPVTQFSPNLGGDRRSMGNALAVASAAATAPSGFSQPRKPTQAVADTVGDRMAMEDRANDPQNPFGNHATEPQPIQNPFGNHAETIDPLPQPEHPESEGLPVAAASDSSVPSDSNHLDLEDAVEVTAAGLDATGAAALTEEHQNSSRPSNASGEARPASPTLPVESTPPSPVGTEFSNTSEVPATPTTPQAGVVKSGVVVTNVHRVQLPFKPSMEDEIELCAGQLVRLLHEYDDGWALCIRIDRSQQGVAPRSCLSSRPVRPLPPLSGGPPGRPNARRPMDPPMGPMGPLRGPPRPMPPAGGRNSPGPFGGPARPMSPYRQQPRPMSPAGMRSPSSGFGGAPRPMSPAGGRQSPAPYARQQRSMSPGPYVGQPRPLSPAGRPRSNSAGLANARRNSPPGPTKMNPNASPSQQLSAQTVTASAPSNEPSQGLARKPLPGQAI